MAPFVLQALETNLIISKFSSFVIFQTHCSTCTALRLLSAHCIDEYFYFLAKSFLIVAEIPLLCSQWPRNFTSMFSKDNFYLKPKARFRPETLFKGCRRRHPSSLTIESNLNYFLNKQLTVKLCIKRGCRSQLFRDDRKKESEGNAWTAHESLRS